jgi:hypothetical protein
MLLNMHDYNHQNGTHRPLFEVEEVLFDKFIDEGHHSHAYYRMPRTQPSLKDIAGNLALLAMPKVLEAHLENFFPMMVLFMALLLLVRLNNATSLCQSRKIILIPTFWYMPSRIMSWIS